MKIKQILTNTTSETYVNPLLQLVQWDTAVVAQHLATDVLADRGGSIELQQHVGLQQVLGAVDLAVGDHGAQAHPLVLQVEDHVFTLQRIAHEVDAPQAGVLVAGVERLEAVAQVVLGGSGGQLGGVVGATSLRKRNEK